MSRLFSLFIATAIIFAAQTANANPGTLSDENVQQENGKTVFSILYNGKSDGTIVLPASYIRDLTDGNLADDDEKVLKVAVSILFKNIDLGNLYVVVPLDEHSKATAKMKPFSKDSFVNKNVISFADNQKNDQAFTPRTESGKVMLNVPISSRLVKNGFVRLGITVPVYSIHINFPSNPSP